MSSLNDDLRQQIDARLEEARAADDALLARVKARVMSAIGSAPDRLHTVRAGDEGWEVIAPGVLRKMLSVRGGTQSCLMRLAPGAIVAAHDHPLDEECVVLEGTLRIGRDLVLGVGDFHLAPHGSWHELATSDTGALVYLRGAADPAGHGVDSRNV